MKRANEIIASTFGMSLSEINECRYQPTRYSRVALYTMGDHYYCCPQARMLAGALPKGFAWKPHADQFFAGREGRVLYVAPMEYDAGEI